MALLDTVLQDDSERLERDALLRPFSSSSSSSSSSTTSPTTSSSSSSAAPLHQPLAARILWTLAFYAPSAALPLVARLLVVHRDAASFGLAALLKGAAFGCMQDAAVFFQTLVVARVALSVKDARLTGQHCYRRVLVHAVTAVALAAAYLWMTLATLVDLSLLLSFLPRLNRGFVEMYMLFAGQFASSMKDALTPRMAAALALYATSMVLWVVAVLFDKVALPQFGLLFCQPFRPKATPPLPTATSSIADSPPKPNATARRRKPPSSVASVGLFSCVIHAALTSLTFRTLCVALMASVSALHATLSLDGTGSDIYLLSNAMFSLEAEDLFRAAQSGMLAGGDADVLKFQSSIERVIGPNEAHMPVAGGHQNAKFPLWRKTVGYKGEKRFIVRTNPARPPNVLLINLESLRAKEIGVIGGRDKKQLYGETVTPFFDELSKSGVLFRQHYTPSIQTSRTLMSTLFGVMPSCTDATAVSMSAKKTLRLHGLPQILKEAFQYTTAFWSAVDLAWDSWREFFTTHGFDTLIDEKGVLEFLSDARRASLTSNDKFSWGHHDTVSFEALENFLERRDQKGPPLFMDIYSITSHDPFPRPPNFTASTNYSSFVTKENAGYVDAVNFVDQQLHKLIANLRRKGLLQNTIVLIEGDHGYGRMEHGNNPTIASSKVYEEATHIPLLILADGLLREQDKGLVVDDLSSQTDLMATIADMLDIKGFLQHGVGQSLVRKPAAKTAISLYKDKDMRRAVVLENPYEGKTIGVRVGPDLKYVRYGSGKYEVFNLTSDPDELAPVETGKLDKPPKNREVEVQLEYAAQVVDMAQSMYNTNGFVPPPKDSAGRGSPPAPALTLVSGFDL